MRLIDADAITEKQICHYLGSYSSCAEDVIDLINDQNTITTGIVHCKDCKYCYYSNLDSSTKCEKWGVYDTNCICEPNEFCSRGVRKESPLP